MQKQTQPKVPKLRFPEFKDEWWTSKLGEISNFWNGAAHEQNIVDGGKYIVVNSKFISSNGKVKKYSNDQISPLKHGDIAIVMSDIPNGKALAKCFLVDINDAYTLNQRIGGINSDKIISPFLINILSRNKYFLRIDNGVSQTNLRRDEVLKCPIIYPSTSEQQRISEFVGSVDKWIKNIKKQKEEWGKYKNGMMQKIFSQKIRFRNEDGKEFSKWKTEKLGNLFDFVQTFSFSREKLNYVHGSIKYIHYGDIHTRYSSLFDVKTENVPYINDDKFEPSDNNCKIGDLVMADASEDYKDIGKTIEIINLNNQKIVAGLHTFLLRKKPNVNIAQCFGSYLFKTKNVHGEIMKKATGISVLGISKNNLATINLPIPTYKEQQKIAEFLTSIDNVIESKQKQIDLAESWKKGLMQRMFI